MFVKAALALEKRGISLALISILILSAGALALAFIAEFAFGIAGCTLCIYQRVPYGVASAVATIAILARASPSTTRLLCTACAVLFAFGCGVAAYHVGVQQGWWTEVGVCEASQPKAMTMADLHSALSRGSGRPACNEVDFSLFGLSLAAMNFIYSAGLAILCGVLARPPLRVRAITATCLFRTPRCGRLWP
jgi:disulfide bond formation protein DsbB